jgi:hypothetical protein
VCDIGAGVGGGSIHSCNLGLAKFQLSNVG